MSDDLQPLPPHEGVRRFLDHRKPSVRDSTLQNARTRLNWFLSWCDERDITNLNDLTGRALSDMVAWRREDIKAITLQKQLSTIRTALRYWADIEGVPEGLAEKLHAPELPDGAESRDVHLEADRAETMLEYLDRYQYASRRHVVMALLWRTGMRRSALRSLDVDDLRPDEHAIVLEHRIDDGTRLKNGESGERWVYLGPEWFQIVADYVADVRFEKTDDEGRRPLITSRYGRPTGDTIYTWVNEATQPCQYGEPCPHDRDPATCEARTGYPSKCPSSRSPHGIRRGSITAHLNDGVAPEATSERMDVSLDVLYEHYDVRTEREKMEVRKKLLDNDE
ncbi:site-specific recombinase XerD [Halarchaeum solikamskense]|uniref:tyrosine-type recombinase/integrase n=1 Tax=Halarchaeum nitratireducens TaxID=489913 RepID=UPI001B3ACCD6|nr:site-specific integrase [Halarchaeum solikamskense]MBP2251178.1 site-specific recombinase XerD [Halarchaeum solikamskense]